MMRKIKLYTTVIGLIFFCSCRTKVFEQRNFNDKSIYVIKYMGSITTQPYPVNEKAFWENTDEHARLVITNNDFLEKVKLLKDTTSIHFEELNYAFIFRNGKNTDTIYCDSTLKSWLLKKDNETIYLYDEKGETVENLRLYYSFFKDCW